MERLYAGVLPRLKVKRVLLIDERERETYQVAAGFQREHAGVEQHTRYTCNSCMNLSQKKQRPCRYTNKVPYLHAPAPYVMYVQVHVKLHVYVCM